MKKLILCIVFLESALCQLRFGNDQASKKFPSSVGTSSNSNEFTHTINRKFFNLNQCCKNAARYCNRPCAGRPCTAQCRVQCGFLGQLCEPVSCAVANPSGCSGSAGTSTTTLAPSTSSCDAGYTTVGSKCYKVVTSSANYLQAILGCVASGATLATVSSQTEQDAVFALTGATGAWIGLTDFLNEGTFSWVDGSAVTYTNWRQQPLQPNNGNNNQHCTQVRPDGDWDDVICDKNQPYVCQKAARPRRFG